MKSYTHLCTNVKLFLCLNDIFKDTCWCNNYMRSIKLCKATLNAAIIKNMLDLIHVELFKKGQKKSQGKVRSKFGPPTKKYLDGLDTSWNVT